MSCILGRKGWETGGSRERGPERAVRPRLIRDLNEPYRLVALGHLNPQALRPGLTEPAFQAEHAAECSPGLGPGITGKNEQALALETAKLTIASQLTIRFG